MIPINEILHCNLNHIFIMKLLDAVLVFYEHTHTHTDCISPNSWPLTRFNFSSAADNPLKCKRLRVKVASSVKKCNFKIENQVNELLLLIFYS